MKKIKGLKNAHTPNTKFGVGDSYGSGVRNPVGKVIETIGESKIKPAERKKTPKALA